MRVLLTRPEFDNALLASTLNDMGIESVAAPLLEIIYDDGAALNLDGVQALLFTSANGVRAFIKRSDRRDIPAFAVGDSTANELNKNGFSKVESAAGDVDTLAALVSKRLNSNDGGLFHPAGSRVAGDLEGAMAKAGFNYSREVLYRAETPDELPLPAMDALMNQSIDGVVLYSPRTAATFAHLVSGANLNDKLKNLSAYCLSQRVADKIKDIGLGHIKVAKKPEQAALLALL